MQGRSWMAAAMLAAILGGAGAFSTPTQAGGPAPVKQKVRLDLRVDGTRDDSGVEVVIKPGHPACRFKPVTYPVKRDGWIPDVLPIDVETFSADRDCSFAIILKEPGHPDRTFRRSLQINAPTDANAGKLQVLQCYLSSRTIAATETPTPAPKPAVATKPAAPANPVAAKPVAGTVRK